MRTAGGEREREGGSNIREQPENRGGGQHKRERGGAHKRERGGNIHIKRTATRQVGGENIKRTPPLPRNRVTSREQPQERGRGKRKENNRAHLR